MAFVASYLLVKILWGKGLIKPNQCRSSHSASSCNSLYSLKGLFDLVSLSPDILLIIEVLSDLSCRHDSGFLRLPFIWKCFIFCEKHLHSLNLKISFASISPIFYDLEFFDSTCNLLLNFRAPMILLNPANFRWINFSNNLLRTSCLQCRRFTIINSSYNR